MATATGAPPPAAVAASARRGPIARLVAGTPGAIGAFMAVLIVVSLAWGVVGAWTADQHASAASAVVHTNEPLSFEAQQMYQKLSDADVTATTEFLSQAQNTPQQTQAMRQRYQLDIAQAGADVSGLKAAETSGSLSAADLSAVSAGLPVYTGYVAAAQNDYTLGYQLTGGSFMQVASEQMHQVLLPAAGRIYAQANTALATTSARATGLPLVAIVLAFSLALGYGLWYTQRWLSRRTKRTFNVGLLGATLVLAGVAVWLLIAFVTARNDLQGAEAHGSSPAGFLAQATIIAQGARGDEVLNLISRSGATSFKGGFTAARQRVGPGASSLLADAAGASTSGRASAAIATAGRDAQAWYAISSRVFSLDVNADYAAETRLVIGSGAGNSAAAFGRVEGDLNSAITADQAVFSSGASAGAGAFGGLAIAFGVAAVLMVIGCAVGLFLRLREYQ